MALINYFIVVVTFAHLFHNHHNIIVYDNATEDMIKLSHNPSFLSAKCKSATKCIYEIESEQT